MARAFNGTSAYLKAFSTPVAGPPLTFSCWLYTNNTTSANAAVVLQDSGATSRITLSVNQLASPKRLVQLVTTDSANTSGVAANYEATATVGAWFHAAGVYVTGSNGLTAYANGVAGANIGTENTTSGIDSIILGAREVAGVAGSFFDGGMARVGIWSVALTAREIAALAKGFCPCLIRPQSLVFFVPLLGSAQDLRGGLTLTDTGTTAADHPRIILPP